MVFFWLICSLGTKYQVCTNYVHYEELCVCVIQYLAEFWQAYVHPRPEASAQVGGTCQYVAQTFVPHEFPASLLD